METTRKRRVARLIAFVLPLMVVVFFGIGWAVYGLWNWLMPTIFGLHAITYWQAFGLMALSWILFGGLRGAGASRGRWRPGMREHWEKMTPAEREELLKGLSNRWAEKESPQPESKA